MHSLHSSTTAEVRQISCKFIRNARRHCCCCCCSLLPLPLSLPLSPSLPLPPPPPSSLGVAGLLSTMHPDNCAHLLMTPCIKGYAWRLCPSGKLSTETEECFQQNHLDFATETTVVHWTSGRQAEYKAVTMSNGTCYQQTV